MALFFTSCQVISILSFPLAMVHFVFVGVGWGQSVSLILLRHSADVHEEFILVVVEHVVLSLRLVV